MARRTTWSAYLTLLALCATATAQPAKPPPPKPGPGDAPLRAYWQDQIRQIDAAASAANFAAQRDTLRRQLAEMLGLSPEPARTDLHPTITGKLDHPQFTVEKLHFQSRPHLYVTANLYLPKNLDKPAPAILYVCGHGNVKKDGVSYGAKTSYQHWGAYLARAGYVCLVIDTLQLGEIEGLHHGTYRENRWDWHSRGYTPAGVEAWNATRAIDYLCSRPEVDTNRIGVTGRSGGGAYSWWVTSLDPRVKAAVPTAGITDLTNHLVDNCIEGHCDCMFMVNTYRWDFGTVAALATPRPLMIQNTDKDPIFPLDGVYRVHAFAKQTYAFDAADAKNLGLVITEGPHKDTQDLQVPALRWFNRHFLQKEDPVEIVATKLFEPEQLKVFKELPADQINTTISDSFVPVAPPPEVPQNAAEWNTMRDAWLAKLTTQTFAGWPKQFTRDPLLRSTVTESHDGITLTVYDFESQPNVPLRLFVFTRDGLAKPDMITLNVLDDAAWDTWLAETRGTFDALKSYETSAPANPRAFEPTRKTLRESDGAIAYFAPRGIGPGAWTADEKKRTHLLRRFPLIGQTADGMRVWDVRAATQLSRALFTNTALHLRGERSAAGIALYASLFEDPVAQLDLSALPTSHARGPYLLNILRFMDTPAALAIAAERSRVMIRTDDVSPWTFAQRTAEKLGWDRRVEVRGPSK